MIIDIDETVMTMNKINAQYWQTIATYKDGREISITIQIREPDDEM